MILHATNVAYTEFRYSFLKTVEKELLHGYVDAKYYELRGTGIPTIGVGVNLQVHKELVLQMLGFDIQQTLLTGSALDAERIYIDRVYSLINSEHPSSTTQLNQFFTKANIILAERALNPVYQNTANFTSPQARIEFIATQSFAAQRFALPTTDESRRLFDLLMSGYDVPVSETGAPRRQRGYEEILDNRLNNQRDPVTGRSISDSQPLLLEHNSNERIALLSLTWQGYINILNNGNPTGCPALTRALGNDDRAEAWYEIRYNTSAEARRFLEADTFGLYNPSALGDADYKAVYRTLTRHRTKIFGADGVAGGNNDYEETNSSKLGTAKNWGDALGITVRSLQEDLTLAYAYLVTPYVNQKGIDITIAWDHILVGEDQSTLYYRSPRNGPINPAAANDTGANALIGTAQNDLIFGESGEDNLQGGGGQDVLYGGADNDILWGGDGSDVLFGGADNDIYIINPTDTGEDRIEDKEGTNTVIFNGIPLRFFVKESGETVWHTLDARFQAEMQGSDLKVTDTQVGNSVILNEDFQEGDFGIRLLDLTDPGPDTATNPTDRWGIAPDDVPVTSTVSVTRTTVTAGGTTTTTTSPSPLPPTSTDTATILRTETVSSETTRNTRGTEDTADDIITSTVVENWYYRGPQPVMNGQALADTLSADIVTTVINGNGGDDTLDGRGVNGIAINGGEGKDILRNGYLIHGDEGDDWIDGRGGPGRFYGDAGDDLIHFTYDDPAGDALADGGAGRDLIFGESTGDNHFIGGDDDDTLDESDLLISIDGNDHLEGGYGSDILIDAVGADLLEGGVGDDVLLSGVTVGQVDRDQWALQIPVTGLIAAIQHVNHSYVFPLPEFDGIYWINYHADTDTQGDVLLGGAGKSAYATTFWTGRTTEGSRATVSSRGPGLHPLGQSADSASMHCGPRLRPSGDDAVLGWNETGKSYRRRNTSISMLPLAA